MAIFDCGCVVDSFFWWGRWRAAGGGTLGLAVGVSMALGENLHVIFFFFENWILGSGFVSLGSLPLELLLYGLYVIAAVKLGLFRDWEFLFGFEFI